ncbi:protein NRT1/ PTR FAMILY 2.11 [Ricinus communis]|uniref:Nitrate transporter, putative n=1 Tax=Ricinus communis TaxID=3988 RepID=B9RUJ9_RICCO|nr:protein NRT1/ PTR FAMILY 2.11 [Ricinus communis]EEF44986.1 nitrate transporter, putative [Ricinus communis]|eukprot:XP_002517444.1 protein NRT1/ PTR FAMILY 2.11 [Ricinus communis]
MEGKEERTSRSNEDIINYRGVKAMPFIIGNEAFEKLGAIGTLSNIMVYLTTFFNMKIITATLLINIFNGTSNVAPLVGAFLSDSYFGHYKTLASASICSLLGMMILTLTAAISNLHPPKCAAMESGTCIGPSNWQMLFLLSGFGFLTIGAGGIRPCNLAFGAEQFDPNIESGKQGIRSFFNWYYFTFTFAMMISATFVVYIQSNVNWAVGLAIPACLMFMSCALFFFGSKLYVKVKPKGSPITSVVQVLVAAIRKRRLSPPHNPRFCLFDYMPIDSLNTRLLYTNQFRWLEKSAIVTCEDQTKSNGSAANPWKLCSIQQVEEAKCVLRVIPIWASAIIYFAAIVQQQTYVVFQALQSDRRLGNNGFKVPAASFIIFSMLTLTIWIPIYDRILMPLLRKLTGNEGGITLLQRMGIGIVLSILTMLVSALVEERRRHFALTRATLGVAPKGGAISSMSALWLVPQLALAGVAETFSTIGQVEFYYRQFPENMRSIAGSFLFLGLAGSSYLSGFLISIVHHVTARSQHGDWLAEDLNKGKLDCFYYMIAALGFLNFCYFLVFAKWYRYKDNNIASTSEFSMEGKQPEKHIYT